jgi:tetratricopeptide (TPR) repeat protein
MDRSLALAKELGEPRVLAWSIGCTGVAFYLNGRFVEGLEHLERALDITLTRCTGVAWEVDTIQLFTTHSMVQLGALKRLSVEVPRALRDAFERGDVYGAVNLTIGPNNMVWLAADDPDEARARVDHAMEQWSRAGFHLEHYFELHARTNADLYAGRAPEALARITSLWGALRRSLLPFAVQFVRIDTRHLRARAALAASEDGGARELVAAAERDARAIARERMAWSTPLATLLRAGVASRRGRDEQAVELLREAARGFDEVHMALYAAAARSRLGAELGGEEGRALVRAAEETMAAEGVKAPAKMVAMLAPGFGRRG